MRTLCDACEAAPAHVFCAADEAALCPKCDQKVHDCNKLASRHVRVTLAEARAVPRCDICENAPAFFFCGIDGTSLCLTCDMNVHVDAKKTHARYLLLGQRVEHPASKLEDDDGKQSMAEPKRVITEACLKKLQYAYSSAIVGGEYLQGSKGNSNASAIAFAVGDFGHSTSVGQHASPMFDLNSQPNLLRPETSGASQSVRDTELATVSDEDAPAVVPDILPRGKSLVENLKQK